MVAAIAGIQPWERRLYIPTYALKEAASYAGVHSQTVAYWQHGRKVMIRPGRPTLQPTIPGRRKGEQLSWLELVEVAVVATFRRMGMPLKVLRETHEYATQELKSEYPFAEYKFKTMGWNLILSLQEVLPRAAKDVLVVTNRYGQTGWAELLQNRFLEFEYSVDKAMVWHLGGDDAPNVALDPRINFGAPTIEGVPVWAIAGRRAAGWDDEEIAEEFGIGVGFVTEASNFADRFHLIAA